MKSPLMWSHYSDGLKGLCIAYNLDSLEKSKEFKLYAVKYNQSPIKYDYPDLKMVPVMTNLTYFDYSQNEDSVAEGYLVRLNSHKYLYQKHERWSYEEELRNIIDPNMEEFNPKIGDLIKYPEGAVSAIIIGSKMKKNHKKMVSRYCTLNDIPVYVASANLNNYTVKINDL